MRERLIEANNLNWLSYPSAPSLVARITVTHFHSKFMIMCHLKVACINGKGQITCYTDNVRSRIKPKPLLFSLAVHWWGRRTTLSMPSFMALMLEHQGPGKEEGKRKQENLFLTIHSSSLIKLSAGQIQRFKVHPVLFLRTDELR